MPPDLIRGWIPVRVEKTRQHKNIERNLDSIRWDCALMDSHLPCFPAQHRLLAGDAPVIAGQRAALAERAVARHHERDRIFSDRGADRAGCLGRLMLVAISE